MDTSHRKIVAAIFMIALNAFLTLQEAEAAISPVIWEEYMPMSTAQSTPHNTFAIKLALHFEEFIRTEKVRLRSELVPICACESSGSKYATPRHFKKDGSVLRGEITSEDIGLCQINTYFHGSRAESMGIDLYSVDGNIEYANYLYEREGSKPWQASKRCWGSPDRLELSIK